MSITFGSGELSFEFVPGWEKLPAGWSHYDVPGVATDAEGNLFAFCRGVHHVTIYSRDGQYLDSWTHEAFDVRAHGIATDNQESRVYLVDMGTQSVGAFTPEGKLINLIGSHGVRSDSGYDGENYRTITRGAGPYNGPADLAIAPSGDLYVADGYGNARVHRFTHDGKLIQSWGEPGCEMGQFHVPHAVWVHTDGRVFVADRENDRIQIFDVEGNFLTAWLDVQRPQGFFIDKNDLVYVAEGVWPLGWESQRRGPITSVEPGRLSIYDLDGNLLLRWTNPDPDSDAYLLSPHGICVDDEGAIYVSTNIGTIGEAMDIHGAPGLLKFARR